MRVAVVHNLQAGGAHRRLSEQMKALPGTTVEICPEGALPVTAAAVVMPLRAGASRVPRVLRPPLRYVDLAALLYTWRRVARRVAALHADVVFANPCHFLQAPAALLWARAPTLYFCDEPRRVDYEPAAAATRNARTAVVYAPLYRAQRWLDRRATTAASRLVTNSRYTSGQIRRSYARHADVVQLGVPDSFRPSHAPVAGHVLSVGTLIPSKGHDLALHACALAQPRRRLVVVAPSACAPEEGRLRGLAARLGAEIEIRTGIDDDELRTLYQTAHATAYLAAREPLGLASLEAQACGCPVVVADEGGLPETVLPGRTGFVVARDAHAARQALDTLADESLRRTMGEAAAAHARRATWRASGETILGHLEALWRAS
jgi:glycosyltransferase involved in cell wall biosynthesis